MVLCYYGMLVFIVFDRRMGLCMGRVLSDLTYLFDADADADADADDGASHAISCHTIAS